MIVAKAGRRWTESEIETLKRLYPSQTAKAIGALIGRPVEATYKQIEKLGLVVHKRVRIDSDFLDSVRALNSAGYSDPEIAAQLGCSRITVAVHRRKLGLEPNWQNERHRSKVRTAVQASLQGRGLANLSDYRTQANRQHAEQNGWPSDLLPTSVAILNALETFGPLTRREICEAIGAPWLGAKHSLQFNRSTSSKGNYLVVLTRRGLVVRLGRFGYSETANNHCWVYSLSLTAERRFPDVAG